MATDGEVKRGRRRMDHAGPLERVSTRICQADANRLCQMSMVNQVSVHALLRLAVREFVARRSPRQGDSTR